MNKTRLIPIRTASGENFGALEIPRARQIEIKTAEGRVCCTVMNPALLCDACKARYDQSENLDGYAATASSRAAVINDAAGIPDGYATALGRKEVVTTKGIPDGYASALPRVATVINDAAGIPDGYATALARRKERKE